jgi:hypothetical protein
MTTRIRPGNGAPKKYYGLIRAKKPEQKPIPANHECKKPWSLFGNIPNGSVFRCEYGKIYVRYITGWWLTMDDEWIKAGGSV